MRQTTLSDAGFDKYRKKTRKERSIWMTWRLIIPWAELAEAIEPFYPKPKGAGRRPIGVERMLRIHFLQHWFKPLGSGCRGGAVRLARDAPVCGH